MGKYLCGNDTFVRHRCTAYLSARFECSTILDVGGEGLLKQFVKNVRVTTANVKKADIILNRTEMPCANDSYDTVTCIDTVEHLPKSDRYHFISECYRVCRKGMVVCAPLGTVDHMRHIDVLLKKQNVDKESSQYLEEHALFGLPTPEEITVLSEKFNGQIYYQGTFQKGYRSINRYLAYPMLILFTFQNMLEDLFLPVEKVLSPSFHNKTNRFFLMVSKH